MTKVNIKKIVRKDAVKSCYHFDYIDHGYRNASTFQEAFFSLFELHNETLNIWSHLICFFCVIVASINTLYDSFWVTDTVSLELLSFQCYLACAAFAFFFSSLYHWFGCLSVTHHDNLLKCDLTGIGILVTGSYIPGVYFSFYCVPDAQKIHMVLTAMILLAGLIAPWIQGNIGNTPIRTILFAFLVAVSLIPFTHWILITPPLYRDVLYIEFFYLLGWYACGFFFYVSKVPEVFFPNNYFITHFLPSHSLWHLCVANAVYCWYFNIIRYRTMILEHGCDSYYT